MARSELGTLAQEETAECWEMVVQQSRELARLIADETGIRHESPQVILFRGGTPVWSASHGGVTLQAMRSALTGD